MNVENVVVGRKYMHMRVPPGKKYEEPEILKVVGVDMDTLGVFIEDEKGKRSYVLASELKPLPYTTVRELIEELGKYDPDMGVELKVSWYHGRNYCSAKKDRWNEMLRFGTKVSVSEGDCAIEIGNDNIEDYDGDEED